MRVLLYLGPSPLIKPKANLIQSLCQYNDLRNEFELSYYLTISFNDLKETSRLISSLSPIKKKPRGILISRFKKIKKYIFLINAIYQSLFVIIIFLKFLILNLFYNEKVKLYIYSRSIIASWIISFFNCLNHIFEVHGKENNNLLQKIQQKIISSYLIKKVYISNALRNLYFDKSQKSMVLHDSSPNYELSPLPFLIHKKLKKAKNLNSFTCVYSGSSGEGRGLELIYEIAKYVPRCSFLIFSDTYQKNCLNNVFHFGYLEHKHVISLLNECDFALMPYQRNLNMGKDKINSLEWMSPLKMFDYMNTNTTIISSYFPVLNEVITDKITGYFIYNFEDPKDWAELINLEIKSKQKNFKKIAENAKILFEQKFSYKNRTKKIIKLFN
tara:strand:- start:90 stop:1244 length:1155 start_codon:yes stop_codon:yes gene_type:complete